MSAFIDIDNDAEWDGDDHDAKGITKDEFIQIFREYEFDTQIDLHSHLHALVQNIETDNENANPIKLINYVSCSLSDF